MGAQKSSWKDFILLKSSSDADCASMVTAEIYDKTNVTELNVIFM